MKHIFVSPHIDDVMLSLGGLVLSLRKARKFVKIEYIFSVSDWVNPYAMTPGVYAPGTEAITAVRKQEEASISEKIGYEYNCLDFLDMPLRWEFTPEDTDDMIARIKQALTTSISKEDACYFPLGLYHADHLLVSNVGFELLDAGYNVFFYEEVPYVSAGIYPFEQVCADARGKGLAPVYQSFDLPAKVELLKQYVSQVSFEWLKDMTNYSYCVKEHLYYERYWSPRQNPLFSERPAVG